MCVIALLRCDVSNRVLEVDRMIRVEILDGGEGVGCKKQS